MTAEALVDRFHNLQDPCRANLRRGLVEKENNQTGKGELSTNRQFAEIIVLGNDDPIFASREFSEVPV